jgi:hypothetical protein
VSKSESRPSADSFAVGRRQKSEPSILCFLFRKWCMQLRSRQTDLADLGVDGSVIAFLVFPDQLINFQYRSVHVTCRDMLDLFFLSFSRIAREFVYPARLFVYVVATSSGLRAVYNCVFCVRFSVRDGATAQQLPLLDSVRDRARKAKGPVGRRRDHGRRNASKKREWKRPLKVRLHSRFF